MNYTVGQRKHLGIALGYPAFVTEIDPIHKSVTLAPKEQTEKAGITVKDLVFQSLLPRTEGEISAEVKIRYAAKPVGCTVFFEKNEARVVFASPQRTPAKGQSAVFYEGGRVLFGGVIV